MNIDADIGLSGYVIKDISAHPGFGLAAVGDATNNKPVKGYLSFDISSISALDDVTIKDISVTIPVSDVQNDPAGASPNINIKVYYYGDLDIGDGAVGGELVRTLSTSPTLANINFTSNKLEDELQKAVDLNRLWFQLKIGLGGVSADAIADWYEIPVADVELHITYEVPG